MVQCNYSQFNSYLYRNPNGSIQIVSTTAELKEEQNYFLLSEEGRKILSHALEHSFDGFPLALSEEDKEANKHIDAIVKNPFNPGLFKL